ncbi:MAG: hypothetical protein PF693_14110 [Spirochaetia bacterium]|jgi:uncharacterized protein YnzC (UPF0291/DUF896 family)|nr:hypothetical protein [Spirochaetia bacterium]
MVLTKKYLEKYQNNVRKTIPDTFAEELLLELGQPFIDNEGHVNEYSEQDIFEQVRKAFQRHFKEVKT